MYFRPIKNNSGGKEALAISLHRFLESQRKFLLSKNISVETRNWLSLLDLNPKYLSETSIKSRKPSRYFTNIYDFETDHFDYTDESFTNLVFPREYYQRAVGGINEALFGMSANYYLGWFVQSPILETLVDYRAYFDYWKKGGGSYVVTDSEVFFTGETDL